MAEATPNDTDSTQPNETQQQAENASPDKGSEMDRIRIPGVDVEADYRASKKYSVSSADRNGKSAKSAATAQPKARKSTGTSSQARDNLPPGDPNEFRSMARDINKAK